MDKKFKMMEDHLEVVVLHEDEIFLPTEQGKKVIGRFTQTTIQHIIPEQVQTLVNFVTVENEKAETQLKAIQNQIDSLKDVKEDIDPEVADAVKKQIAKGTKVFKQKMLVLNNHIEQINKKKQLMAQKEYIETQLIKMRKELIDIKEATK